MAFPNAKINFSKKTGTEREESFKAKFFVKVQALKLSRKGFFLEVRFTRAITVSTKCAVREERGSIKIPLSEGIFPAFIKKTDNTVQGSLKENRIYKLKNNTCHNQVGIQSSLPYKIFRHSKKFKNRFH